MTIGERIKKLRKERKLTLEELASKVNTTAQTIYKYENNIITNIPSDKIELLALNLNSTPSHLMGWDSPEKDLKKYDTYNLNNLSEKEGELLINYRALDDFGKQTIEIMMNRELSRMQLNEINSQVVICKTIDLYRHLASCGSGEYLFDDIPIEKIEVKDSCQADFAISVIGNSMEPTFFEDDILLIDKQPTIQFGEIGLFIIDGEAFIKELGKNKLISHNKNYADIEFKDGMRIDCIGKVIGKLN